MKCRASASFFFLYLLPGVTGTTTIQLLTQHNSGQSSGTTEGQRPNNRSRTSAGQLESVRYDVSSSLRTDESSVDTGHRPQNRQEKVRW